MTKAEAYEKAWRFGFKGDFSLVDEIYYPEYSALEITTDVKVDLNMDKTVVLQMEKQR